MKAVMISIKPKWVERIASGEKTIEVRKTAPKLETPFKCFIYCTKGKEVFFDKESNKWFVETPLKGEYSNDSEKGMNKEYQELCRTYFNGKVIGEFVCDRIEVLEYRHVNLFHINRYVPTSNNPDYSWEEHSCLKNNEAVEYGKFKPLYGLHINNLKIYDKPKELSEFNIIRKCKGNKICDEYRDTCPFGLECERRIPLTRPPQSWCYVEE